MKVVALVSGGKDSCYAMQRCVDFGHQIIALANLLPLEDTVDELDSFMFQTVGHQMVGAIAQCMGLPLFRRRIQGTARTQELRYRKTEGDEVEDLERLLRAVQEKYPDVRAVCSGAIASNYQRLRVENVCSRLGLVSLAYLWKQDQAHLLQQMIDSGIHAVLVKVAAMGLNPHKHLGQDLATLQPHFTLLARLYGSNICGEGGEYESLTLDSPLFKHARICLDEFQVTLHSPDQFAPVGVLHPTKFHLEEKSSLTPPSLDSLVVSVTNDTVGGENLSVTVDNSGLMLVGIDSASFKLHIATVAQRHGVFTFSCWRQGDDSQDFDAGYELGVLLASLEAELQRNGRTWAYVVYVRLFLEDMGHFGRANEVYVQHITELKCERGVPSRCCMQLYLQKGGMGKAMVEVTVAPDLSKKVLHVQSISLWAPSCIGPYSQATLQGQVLHMAGQLGLDPPTMVLVAGGVAAEMEQAVLNCEAVAQEFDISLCTCAITFTVYCSESIGADGQQQTEDILQTFLSRNKRCGHSDSSPTDVEKISTIGYPPLVLYVLVPALPKGAQVEIEPSAFVSSSSACFIDRDSIDDMSTRLEETASGWAWQCVQISSGKQGEAYLDDDDDDEKQQGRKSLTTLCEGLILPTHFCRAFTFINLGSNDHASGLSHHLMQRNDRMQLDPNELKTALEQCMEAVGQVLEQAHLRWSEITVFRIYYVAQLIAVADLQNLMKEILASCSRKAHTYDLQEQKPPPELPILEATFIPTGGVGHSSAVNALVAMDFTAMGSSRSSEHL